jgi:arylsulfatase A-like enzyme
MLRRSFLATLPLLAQTPRRPNVVLLLADDLGSRDLGCYGAEIETPSIDRLASQGMRFERGYSFSVCSPTRSALMTGRSPMRLGVIYTVIRPWSNYGVPLNEHFMPQSFRAAGYQTAITGKWHLGHAKKEFLPNQRGFDHAYGHVNGAIDYYTHIRDGGLDWHRNGKCIEEEGYSTDLIGAEACRWIQGRDRARPFFLYVPFNAPHTPLQAPQELIEKYSKIADPKRRAFAAMVDRMDTAVGRILKTLDDEKVAENTIVLFWSDNGGPVGSGARNTPLRAAKGTVYEGGLRVPGILRWPGQIKPGSSTRQVTVATDLFPTLAGAAGVKPANTLPFDGQNLWPALASGRLQDRSDLFWAMGGGKGTQAAVRRGEWKLVQQFGEGGSAKNELFRLDEDPTESKDLSGQQPALVKELSAAIADWRNLHPRDGVQEGPQPANYKAPPRWADAAQ